MNERKRPSKEEIAERCLAWRKRISGGPDLLTHEHMAELSGVPSFGRLWWQSLESGRNAATGEATLRGLSNVFRLSLEDTIGYLNGELSIDEAWARRRRAGDGMLVGTYDTLPGWAEATRGAAAYVPAVAIAAAGKLPLNAQPTRVDTELVLRQARLWLDYLATPEDLAAIAHGSYGRLRAVDAPKPLQVTEPGAKEPARRVLLKQQRQTEPHGESKGRRRR